MFQLLTLNRQMLAGNKHELLEYPDGKLLFVEEITWAINFPFLYLKNEIWCQFAVFLKEFICLANE